GEPPLPRIGRTTRTTACAESTVVLSPWVRPRAPRGRQASAGQLPRPAWSQPSKSKSRGGFCSNQRRSWSGVSWRTSGVSSSTSSSRSPPLTSSASTSYSTVRSEEHTSELQSPYDLVCRLLLEKKKKNQPRSPLA